MLSKLDKALTHILAASSILLYATTKRSTTKRLLLHVIDHLEKALACLKGLVAS